MGCFQNARESTRRLCLHLKLSVSTYVEDKVAKHAPPKNSHAHDCLEKGDGQRREELSMYKFEGTTRI